MDDKEEVVQLLGVSLPDTGKLLKASALLAKHQNGSDVFSALEWTACKELLDAIDAAHLSQNRCLMSGAMRPYHKRSLVDRLKLLATRVRETYGRDPLRSCGVDDIEGKGIVLADVDPGDWRPGRRLIPMPRAKTIECPNCRSPVDLTEGGSFSCMNCGAAA